jgi:uncharacterized tellurite resistance protein B-like protein
MHAMTVLPQEIRDLLASEGRGEPLVSLRTEYDINGDLGETHVTADRLGLRLISRKLGEEWKITQFAWNGLSALRTEADGLSSWLVITTPSLTLRLRFASWENAGLERLQSLWNTVSATGSFPSSLPDAGPGGVVPLQSVETGVLFAACLIAMARADGDLRDDELELLQHTVGREDWMQAARQRMDSEGLDALMDQGRTALSEVQCRCLLGRMLELGMVDGLLRSSERGLIERCRASLGVPAAVMERIERVLMSRHRLAVFSSDTPEPPIGRSEPLVCFFALLQAFFAVPNSRTSEAIEVVRKRANQTNAWNRAADLRRAMALPDVIEAARRCMDQAQRRCTLATLLAVAMADGALDRSESRDLESMAAALGIGPAEWAEYVEVLAETAGTGVFHTNRHIPIR